MLADAFSALAIGPGHRAIAFDARGDITLARFHAEVRGVAALLPDARHAINLCDDRYRFLVAFCAAASRGQVTLLPSSRAAGVVNAALEQYPDSYCLGDRDLSPSPPHYLRLPDVLPHRAGPVPTVAGNALVAIGFTSGSPSRIQRPGPASRPAPRRTSPRWPTCSTATAAPTWSRRCRRSTCTAWRCRY